jgi:hypothetical protein
MEVILESKMKRYKKLGVSILKDEKEIISSADIIVQLGLLDDDNKFFIKRKSNIYRGIKSL